MDSSICLNHSICEVEILVSFCCRVFRLWLDPMEVERVMWLMPCCLYLGRERNRFVPFLECSRIFLNFCLLILIADWCLQRRLNKVSELIHNSTDHHNLDSAEVSVYFQEILDLVPFLINPFILIFLRMYNIRWDINGVIHKVFQFDVFFFLTKFIFCSREAWKACRFRSFVLSFIWYVFTINSKNGFALFSDFKNLQRLNRKESIIRM